MGRRRKVAIAGAEEEKENGGQQTPHGPLYMIISKAQHNDSLHQKQLKELKQLYQQMDHAAFTFTFIRMIKAAMEAEECNEYADTALNFCAKFVSLFNNDTPSPIFTDVLNWLLKTISMDPHIRYRLCEFVNKILNSLGQDASLDDQLCDEILTYMMDRLTDVSPMVRVQAIQALQRLQVPDDPEDAVMKAYQFHLGSDPSPRVRITVITCMGRNYHTIPYILERLWDIDDKVRRHTYLELSSYPVRSYKVAQRLILLERGLNDRSEAVRKVVVTVMLQQWLESYQNDFVAFVSALKLDSKEEEIDRYRKISKQTLLAIFKRKDRSKLVASLEIENDGEFHHCVPHDKLTIEVALIWQCMCEFFQNEMAEELDSIQPELSTFCAYVEQFCLSKKSNMDKFESMEFQYILLSLMEILHAYDLGDEIGRGNLQKLLTTLLNTYSLDAKIISLIVRTMENLIANTDQRVQYFVDIIQDLCDLNAKNKDVLHDRSLVDELLAKAEDPDLKIKLSTLKVKILELQEEQEMLENQANYEMAQRISDEREAAKTEYATLLKPLMQEDAESEKSLMKVVKPETTLKCLQIAFHMVVSPKVNSLNPNLCQLYKDFICRHFASNQIVIRNWALKCGSAYSMLYQPLAKGVFVELYRQFVRLTSSTVWETAITCIFELIARYGLDNLVAPNVEKSKRTGRLLYHTTMDALDQDDESEGSKEDDENFDILPIMSHFLDKCDELIVKRAIVLGFCRLILYGYVKNSDIMERLIIRYFDPSTDPEINQMLGIFLDNLIKRKKCALMQQALVPTIHKILNSPSDSPLREIKPRTITRFFIEATRGEPCPVNGSIHNGLAVEFLKEMSLDTNHKELCKLLVSELPTLEVSLEKHAPLAEEMKQLIGQLEQGECDPKVVASAQEFRDIIDGKRQAEEGENSRPTNDSDFEDDTTMVPQGCATSGVNSTTTPHIDPALASCPSENAEHPPADEEPRAETSTTYGRDNRTRRSNLRRSINVAQPPPETSPHKIRIEVRIDAETTPQRRRTPLAESIIQEHPSETEPEQDAEQDNEDDTLVGSPPRTRQAPSGKTATPRRKEAATTAKEKARPDGVRSSARTRRNTKPSESVEDELNSSDVVPASPNATATNATRLRRNNITATTATATTRTTTAAKATAATTAAEKRMTRRAAAQTASPKTSSSDIDESSSASSSGRDSHKSPPSKRSKQRTTPHKASPGGSPKTRATPKTPLRKVAKSPQQNPSTPPQTSKTPRKDSLSSDQSATTSTGANQKPNNKVTKKRSSLERSPKTRGAIATATPQQKSSSGSDGAVSPPLKRTRNSGLLTTPIRKPGQASSKLVTPVPAKAKELAPAKTKEATPAKAKESAPARTKEATPAKTKESAPAKAKEPVPAKTKDPVPVKSKDPVLAKAKEPVPAVTRATRNATKEVVADTADKRRERRPRNSLESGTDSPATRRSARQAAA